MSTPKLEEVASEFIETEVETSEMLVLEPLRDHNYTSQTETEKTATTLTTVTKKNIIRRKLKKLPKTTKLCALYNCKLCGYSTMKKEVIEAHKETHKNIKPGTKYKPCDSCNIKTETNLNFKCPDCSFLTKTERSLKVHMRVHRNGTSYKCGECNYNGKDIQDLIKHYQTAKNFCDLCTFSCHLKNKFLAHKKLHETKSKFFVGNNLLFV